LRKRDAIITHFVIIPGQARRLGRLAGNMRQRILEGLCRVDLLGFQTRRIR
jgi:trehalose-6-phosphate synthase